MLIMKQLKIIKYMSEADSHIIHTRFSYHQIVALNRNEENLLWFKLVNVSYIAPLKIGENFCLKITFPFCVFTIV